jgi:beta-lactamase superfamily II metal-dependent hydrolase
VLAWIGETGAEVFRTDRDGKVTVAFGDRGVLVESGA